MTGDASTTPDAAALTKRVLLVEDASLTSEGVVIELKKRRIACDVAQSLAEAVAFLTTRAYPLVSLDLMIPEITPERAPSLPDLQCGLGLLAKIRGGEFEKHGTPRDVPVYVLTCVLESEARAQLSELAPVEVLTKPTPVRVLAEKIRLHLEEE